MPKLAILGAGAIGSKVLSSILRIFPKDHEVDVVFYNHNFNKAYGQYRDIIGEQDIEEYFPDSKKPIQRSKINVTVTDDLVNLSGCNLIIFTIGISASVIKSSSREEALPLVGRMVVDYARIIKKYAPDSVVFMITNPIDITTWLMKHETGFDSSRVIGMGTELDLRRFKRQLRTELKDKGIKAENITGRVIGGHSQNEMILLANSIKINDQNINDFALSYNITQAEIISMINASKDRMEKEGMEIAKLSDHGASFEPALLMAIAARSYFFNKLEVSFSGARFLDSKCGEEYGGVTDCCVSIPLRIAAHRIEIDKSVELLPDEKEKLKSIGDRHASIFNKVKAEFYNNYKESIIISQSRDKLSVLDLTVSDSIISESHRQDLLGSLANKLRVAEIAITYDKKQSKITIPNNRKSHDVLIQLGIKEQQIRSRL